MVREKFQIFPRKRTSIKIILNKYPAFHKYSQANIQEVNPSKYSKLQIFPNEYPPRSLICACACVKSWWKFIESHRSVPDEQTPKIISLRNKCDRNDAHSHEKYGNGTGVVLMPHLMRRAYAPRLSNLRLESNISSQKNIAATEHPLSAESNFQLKGSRGFYSVDIFFQ